MVGPINITKILAIFFSGALLLGVLAIYLLTLFPSFSQTATGQSLQSLPTAFVSAVAMSASLAVGLVVEGASDITVRRFLFGRHDKRSWGKFWPTERGIARFLGQENLYLSHELWEQQFRYLLTQESDYAFFMDVLKNREIYKEASKMWISGSSFDDVSQISASLIFQKDHAEQKNWIISHYSTYFAAANFLVVVLFSWLLSISLFWISPIGWLYFLCAQPLHIVIAYFLASNAFDRFFYSHLCAYRYGALLLLKPTEKTSVNDAV